MALLVTSLSLLAYQLTPLRPHGDARAPAPSMEETRLNNYVLPGPMTPLGNQVMIKLRKADDKTTGGLFVPTGEVETPKEGGVVLAGPGRAHPETGEMIACPVKEGDLVLLSEFTGEKVDYNGAQHIFCDADSLLGSFDGEKVEVSAFKPLSDLLMVQLAEQETATSTGIALAGLEEEDSNSGVVVAVGPGRYAANGDLVPPTVKPGESVMYGRRRGCEVTIDGKKYVVVSQEDCLCKW